MTSLTTTTTTHTQRWHKGSTWNEARTYRDAVTLRTVRQVTTQGFYNQTSNYHTLSGFTLDGEWLVLSSARENQSLLLRCHTKTGDLTALIEPLGSIGGYAEVYRGSYKLGGWGVDGALCIAPRSQWVTYIVGRSLRAVQLQTLEERTLIADIGAEWVMGRPSVSPDETHVLLPVIPAHPDVLAGRDISLPYKDYFARHGGLKMRLVSVPLAGGAYRVVYQADDVACGHATFCPADSDLVLFDQDRVAKKSREAVGEPNRLWTLRLTTGELREMCPRDASRWQSHSVWSSSGEWVYYQGPSAAGGEYIGVMTPDGEIVQEYHFPDAVTHQGHVAAMAQRPAIILDGHLTTDLLLWLDHTNSQPRVEVIARHSSQWGSLPGQLAHPHPQCDPTGRYISFNAAHDGRADVFVVEI